MSCEFHTGDTNRVINRLKTDISIINTWFANNSLVANPSKCQLMFLGVKSQKDLFINIENSNIRVTDNVELSVEI